MRKMLFYSLCVILLMQFSAALVHSENITAPPPSYRAQNPEFYVRELRYEPYPVNPGEWFDIWVKVENRGEQDAPDARFEMIPQYPFMDAETFVKDYGVIRGTISAYADRAPGESIGQDNMVVLKYRVKVADNAPEGTQVVKFGAGTGPGSILTYYLPVTIQKTRTSFDISAKPGQSDRASLTIVNTGDKIADGISLLVRNPGGSDAFSLGRLSPGQYASVSIPGSNLSHEVILSYNDIAGNRAAFQENITVPAASLSADPYEPPSIWTLANILNIVIGLILGIAIALLLRLAK